MRKTKIAKVHSEKHFVRFERRFEDSFIHGYVLDVGPRFFLFGLVSDRLWFDGFECFRIADVRKMRQDPYAEFVKAVLRKRRQRIPKKPRVSMASLQQILLSAGRVFPLVTIHLEKIDPEVCYVGRVLSVDREQVSLLHISPGAIWEDKPTDYKLSDITRVSIGGDYEDALYLVGGEPKITLKTSEKRRVSG